ncbi:hypothetical protein EMCRGX_G025303 [Ephydatia muelleri]
MAEGKEKKTTLPWGLSEDVLKPNSVKGISQTKLKAFSLGRTNPLKKANPFLKKKEEREAKKKARQHIILSARNRLKSALIECTP